MKRNMKATYDLARIGMDRHDDNGSDIKTILAHVMKMREENRRFMFHIKMEMTLDMSEFFPLVNDEALVKFLDCSDPESWEKRKKGFYHLLYNVVHKTKKRFGCALVNLLFTRDFISEHKWPMSGG